MTSILLVDLSSIAYPIWHMSGSDPDQNATSIKTVERVRALASSQPHVAICCDSGRSFRKDLDASYKAQRPEHDAALQHQIKLAIETLKTDGFPVWSAPGYEADDIIGTACFHATMANNRSADRPDFVESVTIASADKDLTQLIGPLIHVHRLADGSTWDAETVKAKLGVAPDQVVDFLALCGDTSDNIKGCRGIGPKTAASLLQKYGNLEDLYDNLTHHGTQFTPAQATSLREFEPRMPLVRELIRLKTDAPIPFDEIFKPRVPADTEVFGDDIDEAMPTLAGDASVAEPATSPVAAGATARPTPAAVASPSLPPIPAYPPVHLSSVGAPIPAPGAPGPTNGAPASPEPAPAPKLVWQPLQEAPPTITAMVPWERQLEPMTLRECYVLAGEVFKSRLFSAYGTAAGVLTTILAGRELGLSAMASLRSFHIIDNKPTLSAELIRSLVLRSGAASYFRCSERTAERATFVTKRGDDPEIALTYTLDEAKIAWMKDDRAWKASGWGRNPADMCVARASSKLARLVYADILVGIYASEEFE